MSSRRSRRADLSGDGYIASFRAAIRRVRRDAPHFLDVFYIVALICILLMVDIAYIGNKHR